MRSRCSAISTPRSASGGQVRRSECVEAAGVGLDGAVAAQEDPAEADADLGQTLAGRDHQRGQEVAAGVVAGLAHRDLRAGEHHGLGQAFEHERQCRGGVGHGVGAVEHDEAVMGLVVPGDDLTDRVPIPWRHVAAVEQPVELVNHELRHALAAQLRHRPHQLGQQARRRLVAFGASAHADRAAGIDHVDAARHGRTKLEVDALAGDGGVPRASGIGGEDQGGIGGQREPGTLRQLALELARRPAGIAQDRHRLARPPTAG